MTASIQDVIISFGSPGLPESIALESFDSKHSYLGRLCKNEPSPAAEDLYKFALDLYYQDLQHDLFLYLFPIGLRAWQEDLVKSHESVYTGFAELFFTALTQHAGFRDLLTPAQGDAVARFMSTAILDKIDQEKSLAFSGMEASPYSWIYTIGAFGTVFSEMPHLWQAWWDMPTKGRACGVLQYVSALMYPDGENPIFEPWTADDGGGTPALWEAYGLICEKAWLPENVDFLRETLTPDYIQQSLAKALVVLHGNIDSHIPELMVSDFEGARMLVELRIKELLHYLSRPLGEARSWSTY
jgi:hypothetical protein